MALRKAFPAERKYEFWNILMCFLVHDGLSISEKERATFGMLAYRMISRAAEAVPLDAVRQFWLVSRNSLISPGPIIEFRKSHSYT